MTQLTVDATMVSKLRGFTEVIEVRDEAGELLGFYSPARAPNADKTVESRLSREEIEKRRGVRSGRPLTDILNDLNGQ